MDKILSHPLIKLAMAIGIVIFVLWIVGQLLLALGGYFNIGVGTFHLGIGSQFRA